MEPHKKWVMDIFDQVAPEFGENDCSYFDYFGKQLVEFANLSPGDHVLDVATGKGAVLHPALQRLGPKGKIVGIDLSRQMIAELRKRVPNHIELLQMDAEHLEFPDSSFDVVFCAFALYFFIDISAALSEFRRVLKPGGRLAVSSFGRGKSLVDWTIHRATELGSKPLKINPIYSIDVLKQFLEAAHFKQIQTQAETRVFCFENFEDWWKSLWTHGVRALMNQLSPQKLEQLKSESLSMAAKMCAGKKIDNEYRVIYGLATAE